MTILQPLKATSSWQCERYFKLHPFGYPRDGYRFSIHKRALPNVFEYRVIGPDFTKVWMQGEFRASDELTTLLVLLIGQLVPVGVVADKIQEEQPQLEKLATKLREWEAHERYQEALKPILKEQQ
jgi:hypothetical protein